MIRRILIDTVLPQLRRDLNYYNSFYITPDSLAYTYPECDSKSDRYDNDECDRRLEEAKQEEDEKSEQYYEQIRAEQYVYSILMIIIAAIVASVHVVFFRPQK